MAIFSPAGGVGAISGSVGGIVFSHNRYGQYMRLRSIPVNPQSPRQDVIRAAVQDLAQRWSDELTQAQRDQWEVYAAAITRTNAVGGQIKLTGFNHYMRSNTIRLQQVDNTIGNGPTDLTLPGADAAFACTIDEAGQQISVAFTAGKDWNNQDFGHLYVAMSIPKAAGVSFVGGPYRIAGKLTGILGAPPASPQVLSVPFPVAAGQVVKCRARISEEDGRLSDFFHHQSSVVA